MQDASVRFQGRFAQIRETCGEDFWRPLKRMPEASGRTLAG